MKSRRYRQKTIIIFLSHSSVEYLILIMHLLRVGVLITLSGFIPR